LMDGVVYIDPRPTADAGPADTNVCSIPPNSIDLDGEASNYISVAWSSPTNPSGSNFSPSPDVLNPTYTFTPEDITNLQVILTMEAYGASGCTDTIESDQIIVNIVSPVVNAGPNQSVCENESISLDGSIGGGASAGFWTGGTGTFNPDNITLNAIKFNFILSLSCIGFPAF